MKKLSEYSSLMGLIAGFLAAVFAFYAGQAVAEHNKDIKAHSEIKTFFNQVVTNHDKSSDSHPKIKVSVKEIESSHELLEQKVSMYQEQNALDIERLIVFLSRMEGKIDAL